MVCVSTGRITERIKPRASLRDCSAALDIPPTKHFNQNRVPQLPKNSLDQVTSFRVTDTTFYFYCVLDSARVNEQDATSKIIQL
jgi:hypothetical protein